MDIRQAVRFFKRDQFESYDFATKTWTAGHFVGQLKYTPESFTVNNLASRKRVLFTAPESRPSSSVIRCTTLGGIYLVEQEQGDLFNNEHYMSVYNVHEARGTAVVTRRAPEGPAEDPGWAVETVLEETFVDIIFDRVTLDQIHTVNQHGIYTIQLPSDSKVDQHDVIEHNGERFFVFDSYYEHGLRTVRATNRADPRRDAVYVSVGPAAFNPLTSRVEETETEYNVTLQVHPLSLQPSEDSNVLHDGVRILIPTDWIGVTPKTDDRIKVLGKTYKVFRITQNAVLDQWEMLCNV